MAFPLESFSCLNAFSAVPGLKTIFCLKLHTDLSQSLKHLSVFLQQLEIFLKLGVLHIRSRFHFVRKVDQTQM